MRVFLRSNVEIPAILPTKVDVQMTLGNWCFLTHMSQPNHDAEKTILELLNMAAIYERRGHLEKAQELHNLSTHLQMRYGVRIARQVESGSSAHGSDPTPDAV
jgi:hypothetical protein